MKLKNYFTSLHLVILCLLVFSCEKQEDENFTPKDQLAIIVNDGEIIKGRFNFESKASLSKTIEILQNESSKALENKFEKYYENGFRSHEPLVSSKNAKLIAKLSSENSKNFSKAEASLDDSFINDPFFAVLVNKDNEIVVNDSLYIFTKDKGLFFSKLEDSTHLISYVLDLRISKDVEPGPYALRQEYGGITKVDDQISMYVAPIDDGGSGGGGGGGYPGPIVTSDEQLQQIIGDLPVCDGSAGGNWVQGIFGNSYVCRSYFDNSHRIKTEFWDQSWLVYKSVGVQVKTQTKTLGIWWASESDEIHLGINRILLKYTYPQPDLSSISHPNLFNNVYKAPLYLYNGTFNIMQGSTSSYLSSYNYVHSTMSVTANSLPFFEFENKNLLNIYIPRLPIVGEYNLNLTTQDITSQSNIKSLYKMGIDFLKKQGVLNTGNNPEFAVTYQRTQEEIEVLYFGERYKKTNDNKIERKLYEDIGFQIGMASTNGGVSWSYTFEPAPEFFRNYTHYDIDFHGLARRGTTWKGNRMLRNH